MRRGDIEPNERKDDRVGDEGGEFPKCQDEFAPFRGERVAFFLAIALVAYTLWRDFGRREISYWPGRAQWVFYGAIGLLVADLAWYFVAGVSGLDALVFFVVLAACGFAMYWTWREQHRYS